MLKKLYFFNYKIEKFNTNTTNKGFIQFKNKITPIKKIRIIFLFHQKNTEKTTI